MSTRRDPFSVTFLHLSPQPPRVILPVARDRLLPDYTAGRALIIALRIAMMMVRNKFQSNIFAHLLISSGVCQ
jgi:hypothetical protein